VLAEQVNDAAWYPLETARLLSALGHIDLSLDPRTLRPESWSVAPPAILLLPGRDEAILAGHRSDQLIAELERCVNVSDGNLSCHQHPGSPDEVCLSGIKGVDIPVVCELVAGATGTNVVFYPSAVASLLALLPTIGEIHACLPSAWNPGGPALQKFDFRQNRWIDVASMRGTGAYRFLSRPARYGFLVDGGVQGRRQSARQVPRRCGNRHPPVCIRQVVKHTSLPPRGAAPGPVRAGGGPLQR